MRRALSALTVLCCLAPAVAALVVVNRVPASALTIPKVHIATESDLIRVSPADLGATRTSDGLQLRQDRLDRTLSKLAATLQVEPSPGAYEMTDQGVVLNRGTPGRTLDVVGARVLLVGALRGGPADLTLPLVEVPPPAPPPFAIIVRLSEFRLDLYEGTALRGSYPVGVGALRYATPPGVYHIKSKSKNPSWNNPGSPWAKSMPKYLAPGPKNPLGTRAMRLDREALVIHGTPHPSSVGHRSSHGCMRMRKDDVEALYDIVPVQTPVFIVP